MVITVDKAKPGMKLSHAVADVDRSGMLAAGTCLTAQHLLALKRWKITTIEILPSESNDPVPGADAASSRVQLENIEAELDHRLKFVSSATPGITQLRALALNRAFTEASTAK